MKMKIVEPHWKWNNFMFGIRQHWTGCVEKYWYVSIGFFAFYIVPKNNIYEQINNKENK